MTFPIEYSGHLVILALGFGFGFFLEASGLASPRKLNAQFALRDWTVFKVMFGAILVAAIGLWLFESAGWLQFDALKIPTAYFWAMALGGALLGTGLAIGGYCPGTSVAGLFSGRIDALFFMIGIVIGAILFAVFFDEIQGLYLAGKGPAGQTLSSLTDYPKWVILLILVGVAIVGFKLGSWFEKRDQGVIKANQL